MNKLITNTLLAPTPSATGTIGAVVEHEVIFFGFPPLSIRSNPSHPAMIQCPRSTFFIILGGTFLRIWIGRTLIAESLTLVTVALQVDAFTWAIGTVLSPSLIVTGGSTTPVLVLLVIFIIQGGIDCSCSVHDSLVVSPGGRGRSVVLVMAQELALVPAIDCQVQP